MEEEKEEEEKRRKGVKKRKWRGKKRVRAQQARGLQDGRSTGCVTNLRVNCTSNTSFWPVVSHHTPVCQIPYTHACTHHAAAHAHGSSSSAATAQQSLAPKDS